LASQHGLIFVRVYIVVTNFTYYQNSQSRNSQLLQSDGISAYTWDNNGNLLAKGSTNYTWDYDDRLTGISGGSVSASYVYDYQGERIKKTVGGVETGYLYQAEDIIKESSGGVVTDYLHGIGIDDPVMLDRSGAKSYYFGDGLGSIRELTDTTGTIQNNYSYGAWGELRASSATVGNSYGYTGREFAEEGMYFYRARYLDPGLGRFVSEDPMRFNGGMNFFGYVGNNPVNYIDPLGLVECKNIWEQGKEILVDRWEKVKWEGYWEALALCSFYRAAIIYNELFELSTTRYPDFRKFTIVTYTYGKYEETINWYHECRDDCGKLLSKEFLFNTRTGKMRTYIMNIGRETAYAPDYYWWQAVGK